jgi:hypothetical protein
MRHPSAMYCAAVEEQATSASAGQEVSRGEAAALLAASVISRSLRVRS